MKKIQEKSIAHCKLLTIESSAVIRNLQIEARSTGDGVRRMVLYRLSQRL